jgi:preprotein translocase subunit SecG
LIIFLTAASERSSSGSGASGVSGASFYGVSPSFGGADFWVATLVLLATALMLPTLLLAIFVSTNACPCRRAAFSYE